MVLFCVGSGARLAANEEVIDIGDTSDEDSTKGTSNLLIRSTEVHNVPKQASNAHLQVLQDCIASSRP